MFLDVSLMDSFLRSFSSCKLDTWWSERPRLWATAISFTFAWEHYALALIICFSAVSFWLCLKLGMLADFKALSIFLAILVSEVWEKARVSFAVEDNSLCMELFCSPNVRIVDEKPLSFLTCVGEKLIR